ncbi:MAG: hypothetical protein QNI90_12180 [Dinoroseobacter sp.]|nr:hypothetical protein [Dinoroseobacter sp.]
MPHGKNSLSAVPARFPAPESLAVIAYQLAGDLAGVDFFAGAFGAGFTAEASAGAFEIGSGTGARLTVFFRGGERRLRVVLAGADSAFVGSAFGFVEAFAAAF